MFFFFSSSSFLYFIFFFLPPALRTCGWSFRPHHRFLAKDCGRKKQTSRLDTESRCHLASVSDLLSLRPDSPRFCIDIEHCTNKLPPSSPTHAFTHASTPTLPPRLTWGCTSYATETSFQTELISVLPQSEKMRFLGQTTHNRERGRKGNNISRPWELKLPFIQSDIKLASNVTINSLGPNPAPAKRYSTLPPTLYPKSFS